SIKPSHIPFASGILYLDSDNSLVNTLFPLIQRGPPQISRALVTSTNGSTTGVSCCAPAFRTGRTKEGHNGQNQLVVARSPITGASPKRQLPQVTARSPFGHAKKRATNGLRFVSACDNMQPGGGV